ncbi:MAG: hypothetical protein CMJ18_10875 [Phycisphaeraceae bacterium]|nr:hypothetical protein [Phycisphaeraceae bacterium]
MIGAAWSFPLFVVSFTAGCSADRPEDFGRRWVRSHPYTLMGLCLNDETHDFLLYKAAGFNHVLAWKPWREALMEPMAGHNLTWFGNIPWITPDDERTGIKRDHTTLVPALTRKYSGNVGWLVNDEPTRDELNATAEVMEWIRGQYPDALIFSNLGADLDYSAHAQRFLQTLEPDVMMYDSYPFNSIKATWDQPDRDKWFARAGMVRKAAMSAGVPYWAFAQSIDRSGEKRLSSESNLRMQLFVYLTYGYTGQAYFIYDYGFKNAPGLLDEKRRPSHIYNHAAIANPEVANLGRAIRFLTSTGVFAAPTAKGVDPFVDPEILATWKPHGVANDPLRSVRILDAGPDRHGLIGYFVDDRGQTYFMLTNLWRKPGQIEGSGKNTTLSFRLVFDRSVRSIWRLDRRTGRPKELNIADPAKGLDISLPGGTGDLFKIGNGKFAGV